ncbi:hypothetical protein OESDEN_14371 [Oesophagostomum dentatum]|uniref:Uncharacterized protein n=1 Tax=Oesophagostomum dentatum TaxID=61180 RepID=A0A0B1SKN0_OESDE|nr:hypothetical protein OESDEN_14371 [Oesophagostomum dentatum]
MAEPVTPFEPIDPSRMLVANADRSGTAQRVPKPRFPRRGAALSASLFADSDERTPRPLRSNLLKRMGDYKPNKIVEETAAPETVTEPVGTTSAEPILANASVHDSIVNTSATNSAERSIMVPPAPPPTAADTSCISLRAAAGKNAIPSTSAVSVSPSDGMLADAARSLSLEDLSPGGDVPAAVDDMNELPAIHPQALSQKLLAESLCTVDTPHRAPIPDTYKRRISIDIEPMDDGPALTNGSASSESEIVYDDPIEVRPQSRCSSRGSKGEEVMVLKPRVVERQRRLRELRKAEARKRKEKKIRELKRRHRRGEDLETTVDSIVTSSDEDEEEDIEAMVHVR